MASFSERVRELRQENSWSQPQLAERLGLTKQSISLWERGIKKPEPETFEKMCELFGVTAEYLMGTSDERVLPTDEDINAARWRAEEDDELLALNLSKFCRLSPNSRRIVMAALNEAFRVDRENGVLEAEGEYKVTVRTTWLDKPPYGYGNYKSKQEDQ